MALFHNRPSTARNACLQALAATLSLCTVLNPGTSAFSGTGSSLPVVEAGSDQARVAGVILGPHADIFSRANEERLRRGLPPLSYSPVLSQAAAAHARDMAAKRFFAHSGSDGSTVGSRVSRAGYAYVFVGENIAMGYHLFPQAQIFQLWMGSQSHRKNILLPRYRELGVGMAIDRSTGQRYYTQVFGAPMKAGSPM